ncbi:tetratricopeptide repeat protein 4-like [Orbicella faveolata]|uniref:tetratricopeptide repeat protein 4-like n=1 Tax=Orbicella faveolata TaxID=48498 RepID=UPI0009E62326|nr:tetratricopeptide repeat protein 4-like [Orbicella faveolata]
MMNPSDSQGIDSAGNDALAREPVDTAQEQSSSQNMDLADNDALTETAKVYKELGDAELAKEEFQKALSFYTEGINVKCKDEQLNVELYRCRWLSNCHLGNVHEASEDLIHLQEITGPADTTHNEATLMPEMVESDDDTLRGKEI